MAHYASGASATQCDMAKQICKPWAPLRCKIAGSLFVTKRVWTANWLAKRGLPHNEKCVFCKAAEEDPQHLFIGCTVISIIWTRFWDGLDLPRLPWSTTKSLYFGGNNLQSINRKKLNSLIILVSWSTWRQRNNRVFEKAYKPIDVRYLPQYPLMMDFRFRKRGALVDSLAMKQWRRRGLPRFRLPEGNTLFVACLILNINKDYNVTVIAMVM
jgi:hypothetical protein